MTAQTLPPSIAPSPEDLIKRRHEAANLKFFPRMSPKRTLSGGYMSNFRGRGMDFSEVRPYQAGDDIRNIDWRVTARTTCPHTKLFHEERERPVLVAVDLRQRMFFGSRVLKSVAACEIASTLLWAGLQANDRVGGLFFGPNQQQEIKPRRSHHTVLQCIHALSEFSHALQHQQTDQINLAHCLADIRKIAHPGFSIMLVSDFHDFDRDCERHLFDLARHCDLTLCHVYDVLETKLPPPGRYPIFDGQRKSILHSEARQTQNLFSAQYQIHWKNLQRVAKGLRIGLLSFMAGQAVQPVLQQAYGSSRHRVMR